MYFSFLLKLEAGDDSIVCTHFTVLLTFLCRGVAIEMTCAKYVAPTFTDEIKVVAFPQNLPSIVVSHILNPQPGETILDMCAAPGE